MNTKPDKPDVTFDLYDVVDREITATVEDVGRVLVWPLGIVTLVVLTMSSRSCGPLFWVVAIWIWYRWRGRR